MRRLYGKIKSAGSALAIAAAVLSVAAPAASASGPAGIPLRPGTDCGIQVYLSNSAGVVMPKAAGNLSGSYRFHLYQAIPSSDVDIRLGGRFSGSGAPGDSTILARNLFQLGFVAPGAFRGMDELRDAEIGQDAHLVGSLQVYDRRGRLICSTDQVHIMPHALLTVGRARPAQPTRPGMRARQPEQARLAQERLAQRQAQPARNYRLTRAQCERLRAARPAQCRYDD